MRLPLLNRFRASYWKRDTTFPPFAGKTGFGRRFLCALLGHRSKIFLHRDAVRSEKRVECRRCGAARKLRIP